MTQNRRKGVVFATPTVGERMDVFGRKLVRTSRVLEVERLGPGRYRATTRNHVYDVEIVGSQHPSTRSSSDELPPSA